MIPVPNLLPQNIYEGPDSLLVKSQMSWEQFQDFEVCLDHHSICPTIL